MSEPTMAPLDTDEASAPPSWQERKALLGIAGAAVVVLLGLGAWFLVFSGGESDDDGLVASARTPGAVATGAAPGAPEPEVTEVVPDEFDMDLGNDPFKPLYAPVVEDAPADQADTAPTDPEVVAPDVTVPDVVSPFPTYPDTQPQVPSAPSVPTTAPQALRVKLVSVDADAQSAVLQVDGERVTVKTGATFGAGSTLTLYRVSDDRGGVATVYRGDDLEATGKDITKGETKKF